jgi:hypothetical protein
MKKLKFLLMYIIGLVLVTLGIWAYLSITLSESEIFLDPKEYKIKQYELAVIQNLHLEKWIFEKDGYNYAILINPSGLFKIVKAMIFSQFLYTILFILIVLLINWFKAKRHAKARGNARVVMLV